MAITIVRRGMWLLRAGRAGLGCCIAAVMFAAPILSQQQPRSPAPVGRLVGVFDERTGAPISGAEIRDIATGASALTSETGTLSLSFVDTAGSMFRVTKIGYKPIIVAIANSRRDSIPVTLLLAPLAQTLAPVVSTARSSGDTNRTLDRVGFYSRRATSVAPTRAFATAEQLQRLTTLADLRFITGRDICAGNVFLDGHRINLGGSNSRRSKIGADDAVGIENIAGIETYIGAEVPVEYGMTRQSGSMVGKLTCATLIWTK